MDKTQLSQVVGGASTDVVTSSIEADRVSGGGKGHVVGNAGNGLV